MKEYPIIFKTEMVKAILEGRKTQTRRIFNNVPDGVDLTEIQKHSPDYILSQSRYGNVGDLLWVRETFTPLPFDMVNQRTTLHFSYFADCDADSLELAKEYGFKWKPSIHMPKEAARIWLINEGVKVERVAAINAEGVIKEGIRQVIDPKTKRPLYYFYPCGDLRDHTYVECPKVSFISLWQSINGKPKPIQHLKNGKLVTTGYVVYPFNEDWAQAKFHGVTSYKGKPLTVVTNPWVEAISFNVVSTTGKPEGGAS